MRICFKDVFNKSCKIRLRRIINAAKNLILFSAVVHIFILFSFAVLKRDITYLNYFNVLDLDFFFSGIEKGAASQILSILVMIIIFLFFYFRELMCRDTIKHK